FEKSVAHFADAEKITKIIRSLQEAPVESWIPSEPVEAAKESSLEKLRALGISPMPLAAGNPYLMVNFSGFGLITDEQIRSLQEIRQQLVWLNLSHTQIKDEQMEAIAALSNLRVLYLNNTDITDKGLSFL